MYFEAKLKLKLKTFRSLKERVGYFLSNTIFSLLNIYLFILGFFAKSNNRSLHHKVAKCLGLESTKIKSKISEKKTCIIYLLSKHKSQLLTNKRLIETS